MENQVIKKILLLLITWAVASTGLGIVQSCCNPDPATYRLESIWGEINRIVDIQPQGHNETEHYITEVYEPDAAGIRYDSMGIHIFNVMETLVLNAKGELLNRSFACSPNRTYERLADLVITSDQDYSTSFPAGSDLKELMSFRYGPNPYYVEGDSISTFLANAGLGPIRSSFITLSVPPEESKIHDLTIRYLLKDGREYFTMLEGIRINP